jgi:hypothetical protein
MHRLALVLQLFQNWVTAFLVSLWLYFIITFKVGEGGCSVRAQSLNVVSIYFMMLHKTVTDEIFYGTICPPVKMPMGISKVQFDTSHF